MVSIMQDIKKQIESNSETCKEEIPERRTKCRLQRMLPKEPLPSKL
jgi:hypothetical protein